MLPTLLAASPSKRHLLQLSPCLPLAATDDHTRRVKTRARDTSVIHVRVKLLHGRDQSSTVLKNLPKYRQATFSVLFLFLPHLLGVPSLTVCPEAYLFP